MFATVDEIVQWIPITRAYVGQLVKEGILKYATNSDGDIIFHKYNLQATVRAYISYVSSKRKDKPVSQTELDQARVERIRGQSERNEIEMMKLKGELINADELDGVMADMLITVRNRLLGIPAHVTRMLLGRENYDEVCGILTEEIEKALEFFRPITVEEVRAQNQKLKGYQDIANEFDNAKKEEQNEI